MGEAGRARGDRDGPREERLLAEVDELHALRQEAQLRAAQQAVMTQLSQELVALDNLDTVLQRICATVAGVLDAEWCHVLELSPDGRRLRSRAGVGWGLHGADEAPATAAGSQAAETLGHDSPVVVADAGSTHYSALLPASAGAAGSAMSVRIPQAEGTPYGVLALRSSRTGAFGEDDAAFLHSVANLVGAAVDRQRAAAELERLSLYDGLTGLPNRSLLLDRLDQAVGRTRGAPGRMAVIFLDLDRLKLVNDALGHAAGDDLLAAFARRLAEAVRAGDTAGRLGGDEFVVVCEGLPGDEAAATAAALEVAGRLNAAVSGHYRLTDGGVYVTPSVGVAVHGRGEDARTMLRHADAAMYRAKQRGRGSIDVFDARMRAEASERLELVEAFRRAQRNEELFLLWQPTLALDDGGVLAVEAFLRWRHPELGVLPPDRFIRLAEETGLIVPVGAWALTQACAEAAGLPANGQGVPPAVAVNVSPRQLLRAEFLEAVGDALDAAELPAEQLVLEIAEPALCRDAARMSRMLGELRTRGVRVALDDVGTGEASLTRLTHMPCDILKIDRAVVAGAMETEADRALLGALVATARALGLTCVGKGIESTDQLELLRALGCDAAQGAVWTPPVPRRDLARWLSAREPIAAE